MQFVIDGDLVDSITGGTFETIDPRNGEKILDVADGSKEDVDKAVRSARKAFDEGPWPRMGGKVSCQAVSATSSMPVGCKCACNLHLTASAVRRNVVANPARMHALPAKLLP